MSSPATPVKPTGCVQSYIDFHNEGTLKLSESCSCVSHLEIRTEGDDADGFLAKIAKVFALVVCAIPLCIFHLLYTLYNKITDCCGKSTQNVDDAKKADALKAAQELEKQRIAAAAAAAAMGIGAGAGLGSENLGGVKTGEATGSNQANPFGLPASPRIASDDEVPTDTELSDEEVDAARLSLASHEPSGTSVLHQLEGRQSKTPPLPDSFRPPVRHSTPTQSSRLPGLTTTQLRELASDIGLSTPGNSSSHTAPSRSPSPPASNNAGSTADPFGLSNAGDSAPTPPPFPLVAPGRLPLASLASPSSLAPEPTRTVSPTLIPLPVEPLAAPVLSPAFTDQPASPSGSESGTTPNTRASEGIRFHSEEVVDLESAEVQLGLGPVDGTPTSNPALFASSTEPSSVLGLAPSANTASATPASLASILVANPVSHVVAPAASLLASQSEPTPSTGSSAPKGTVKVRVHPSTAKRASSLDEMQIDPSILASSIVEPTSVATVKSPKKTGGKKK